MKKNQYHIFRWKFINGETYSKKKIMEHTICVILRLLSVEVLHTDIEYTTVVPPAFPEDSLPPSNYDSPKHASTDKHTLPVHASTDKHTLSVTSRLNDKKSRNDHESGDVSTRMPINTATVLAWMQDFFSLKIPLPIQQIIRRFF